MQETPVKRRGLKIAGSIAALIIPVALTYFVRHRDSNIGIQAVDAVVYTKSCVGTTYEKGDTTLEIKRYASKKEHEEVRLRERGGTYALVPPDAADFQKLKSNAENGVCE